MRSENVNGNYKKQSRNYFSYEIKALFQNLDLLDIKISTIAFILRVKESVVWKWKTYQLPVPDHHRKKLEKLSQKLSQN